MGPRQPQLLPRKLALVRTMRLGTRVRSAVRDLLGGGWPVEDATAWLIGDALDRPSVAACWLELARTLRRQESAVRLLLLHDTPWEAQLVDMGCVLRVSLVLGMRLEDFLALAGCGGVVSLDAAPDGTWRAPSLARRFHLPLCAPASPAAHAAGAYPLPELLSRAVQQRMG